MREVLSVSKAAGMALAAGGAMMLAACNSPGNKIETTLDPLQAQQSPGSPTVSDEVQDLRGYCPNTVMRAGTETYNVYPDKMKKDDPEAGRKLRFRATITDVVRECNYAGPVLNMRVGVAGRILSGPSGETGSFLMPVRIAVTQAGNVLYSKLHDVPAEVPPGRTNNTFAYVDSEVSIPRPDSQNVIIYVGFDELRVDLPNAVPPKQALDPIN